jgi:hypothetical protein
MTERGARKAIFEGHMYTKHKETQLGVSWRCDQRGTCTGRITVDEDDQVVKSQEHSHAPDWGRCKAKEVVQSIKRAAETSRAPSATVVQSKVSRVTGETALRLPKNSSLKKMVRRIKRQHLPPEPTHLNELEEIPARFRVTLKGTYCPSALSLPKTFPQWQFLPFYFSDERWLLYFDPQDEEKIIIFSSNSHLRLLARADFWVMDGTFKSAPRVVTQIYAIHASVGGKWLPLVIALMENKNKESYVALLDILKEETQRRIRRPLEPAYISTDYEKGAMSAVRECFPGNFSR